MIDRSAAAFLEQAIEMVGVEVTLTRLFGYAPNVSTFSVTLKAKVDLVQPNTTAPAIDGLSASQPGAISQNDRTVILMAKRLRESRFPLPIVKGDKVTLPATLEEFDVTRIDPDVRAIAGAVTLTVTGVS